MSDVLAPPTKAARRQLSCSPTFRPTDRASIPSPHSRPQKLPSLRELHLPTPPTSGELPTIDDFAAEQRANGYQRSSHHHRQSSQFADSPLFGPNHDSRQSSLSPRTTAPKPFPLALDGRRYGPVYRALPPLRSSYDTANNYAKHDQIICNHKAQVTQDFERRHLSPPADDDYHLAANVWHGSHSIDRKYGPYAPTREYLDDDPRTVLKDVQANQKPAKPAMPPEFYGFGERATRPSSVYYFHGNMTESSPVRDREASIQSHYYDFEDENAASHASQYQTSGTSGRTLAAKRPRIVESPEDFEPTESHSMTSFSLKGRRNRSDQSIRRSSKITTQSISSSVAEAKHSRSRSTKPRKSSNISDYLDYAPPVSTMQNPIQRARELKGLSVKNPIDLNSDDLRHQLCDAERIVAQSLNISCKDYLLVKRQVFGDYVAWLRDKRAGKQKNNWNKTAAQRSSNIDVGKVSQVFVFFQAVGWFEEKHFQDFL